MARKLLGVDSRSLPTNVDTVPPSQVTGLASSAVTTTTATITWSASTDASGIGGYNVYDATIGSGTDPILLGTTAAGVRTFNLTGLVPGSINTIWVTAFDSAPAHNENILTPGIITVTTTAVTDTTPPTVPTGLAAGIITPTSIDLTWAASSDTETGVDHYICLVNAGSPVNNTDTSFTYTGLTASTSYSLTVKAVDGAGNTSAASTALVRSTSSAADVTPPSQVTGLTVDTIGSTTVDMHWAAATDNSGTIASYRIYWNGQAGGATVPATVFLHANAGTDLTYTATGLTPATDYRFAVSATDPATNEGTKSGTVPATTSAVSGGTGMLLGMQGTNQHDQATGNPSLCRLGDRIPANGWAGTGSNVLVDANGNGVRLGLMRSYYTPGSFPTAFSTSFGTGGFGTNIHHRVQVCFKGNSPWTNFQNMAQGDGDVAIMRFINSIPSGWEVPLTYHHEPNNDWSGTNNTPEWLRQAYMRIGALIEGRSMPSGQPVKDPAAQALALNSNVVVYQEPCFTVPTSATANDWGNVKNCIPNASLMDAHAKLCVDAYQNPPPPITQTLGGGGVTALYPTPGAVLNYFLNNVLAQYGYATPNHGWTVGEWMAPLRDNDNANHDGQTNAIVSYLNFCATASPQPAYRVCLWEDKYSMTDGSGAKYNQTLYSQGKKAVVDFANGPLVRV